MAADRARSAVVRSASGQRNQSDVQYAGQSHPLGRLWDIDVICPQNGLVGRQSLGESQRRCLLCDEPAHACARSRRHDTDLVVARVEQMIDAWFARD